MFDSMKAPEDMSYDELIAAIDMALAAFQKNYKEPTKAGKARARKASLTLEKLTKQYRRLTVAGIQ